MFGISFEAYLPKLIDFSINFAQSLFRNACIPRVWITGMTDPFGAEDAICCACSIAILLSSASMPHPSSQSFGM